MRDQGPVEILCREIGFAWDRRLERTDLFVAFVRELLAEISHIRHMQEVTQRMGGSGPTEGSSEALGLAARMLEGETREDLIARAAEVHNACHRLNPEGTYPTDHLIDMVSSCASAIRFGLETPCNSRHAASAADHVWKQAYGVSRSDNHTPDWRKSWARDVLVQALVALLPADVGEPPVRRKARGAEP